MSKNKIALILVMFALTNCATKKYIIVSPPKFQSTPLPDLSINMERITLIDKQDSSAAYCLTDVSYANLINNLIILKERAKLHEEEYNKKK